MWQVLDYQVARGDQCKGEQSLNLCGNLDGDLKHAEQLPNVNPFLHGQFTNWKNINIKFCVL